MVNTSYTQPYTQLLAKANLGIIQRTRLISIYYDHTPLPTKKNLVANNFHGCTFNIRIEIRWQSLKDWRNNESMNVIQAKIRYSKFSFVSLVVLEDVK